MISFFFFSSRRRHTRSLRDWSSDVCSSDLAVVGPAGTAGGARDRTGSPPRIVTVGRIAVRIGGTDSVLWLGRGLLEDALGRLVSPSGRFLLVSSRAARSSADRLRPALAQALILDLEIEDSEEAKTLD